MTFLCPYTIDDAVCFQCEHGNHDDCDFQFTAYGKHWTCTCCVPDSTECEFCGETDIEKCPHFGVTK